MRRFTLLILLGIAVLAIGCSRKPPREILGVWQSQRDLGILTVTDRLELKPDGTYALTRVSGGGPTFTGGPVTGGVENLHTGNYSVKGDTLELTATSMTVGGLEMNVTDDMSARSKFRLQGVTLTINDGAVFMVEKIPAPREPNGEARPAEGLSGAVTMTRSGSRF